jgi:hypothetical protein
MEAMTVLYNPEWIKKGEEWVLLSAQHIGRVRPQVTRDYSWSVHDIVTGQQIAGGSAPDRIAAYARAEKVMGYRYLLEKEYAAEPGCRCGSCSEPTGRWIVSNRQDTVEEYFSSEGEAVAWILEQHATISIPATSRTGDER